VNEGAQENRSGSAGPGGILVAIVSLLLVSTVAVADEAGDLASELSRLRGEVEALSADLELKKEDRKVRLRSLASQKSELEMEIQREELRLRQLKELRTKQKDRVATNEGRKSALRPAIAEAIDIVRQVVEHGLPFKKDERLADIDKLDKQLADGTLGVPSALARLWSKVEDEFRLGQESGLYKQAIPVGSDEVLADVARLGMVMLYFRTPDDRYGRAVRTRSGWKFELYRDEQDAQRVRTLMDAFKKHIRVGYFELPDALPLEAAP
jgi:hypothetical protein